ncbi:F0F1 ATP synthase subunit B family protein [Kaarinaea lacus]
MQIDWVTVVAQIINFLVLVYLLKRFLYGPIINAMERRERAIAAQQQQVQEQLAEAERETSIFRDKSKALEQQRQTVLAQAKNEADQQRNELLQQLREEIQQTRLKWYTEVQREQEGFLKALRQEMASQATSIARQALKQLANADLENEIVRAFIQQIQSITDDEVQAITAAYEKSAADIVITSRFEIPSAMQQELSRVLRDQLGIDVPLRFNRSEDLFCGIGLQVSGYKLVWSVDDYLVGVEERLQSLLTDTTQPQAELT